MIAEKSGNSFAITQDNSSLDTSEKNNSFYHHDKEEPTDLEFSNTDLIRENLELKDASEKTTKFQSTNNLIKEIQFPKAKSKELITALDKCAASVFIRFDAKGVIQSIEPDTIREPQFENVDDDYTY